MPCLLIVNMILFVDISKKNKMKISYIVTFSIIHWDS